ncbi:hypothetical protein EDD17DRAFT_1573052 [Pisolithus thermaeus]|nr:hypothetical protein EDD17DRAFT_1573052 [Pisolithus thermaeus]
MAYRYLSVGSVSVRLLQNAHEGDILANALLGIGKQGLPAAGCDETFTVWIAAPHSLVTHILAYPSNVPVGRREPNTWWKTGLHTWHCGKGCSGHAVHVRKWLMIRADNIEDAARTSLFQREKSASLDDYMVPATRRCSAGPFLASPGLYKVMYGPRLNAHNAYRHFEFDFNVSPSTKGIAEEMKMKKRSTAFK